MDWGANAVELTREKKGYPKSAYCPSVEETTRWGTRLSRPGFQHYVANPTRQRKSVGTRRTGAKGRKMPIHAKCSGCQSHVVLVDNIVDRNWPLYINKLTIIEWP